MRLLLTPTQQPYHNAAVCCVDPLAVVMSAVVYDGAPSGYDRANEPPAACKHPGIEGGIAGAPLEVRMRVVEHEKIGAISRRDRADALPEGLGTAGKGGFIQAARSRRPLESGQGITRARMESLTIFELPQLAGRGQLDVGVAADAPSSAGIAECNGRKGPISEIGLGKRTKARYRLTLCQSDRLL